MKTIAKPLIYENQPCFTQHPETPVPSRCSGESQFRILRLLAQKRMNTRVSIWPWLLTVTLIACVGFPSWAGTSKNPLIGRWLLQRKGVAAAMPYKLEWEFTKDEVVVRIVHSPGNSKEASRNKYTIDTDKSPKWITVTIGTESPEIRRGIFEIVGDELHLKQAIGGGPRPTDFGKDDYSVLKKLGQQDGPANRNQPHR
ncbi:MAG: hypothetical protein M1608_10310 [Candidatus Omnitrophica bacterium]|nr:hypothetical protein [Candidatus Omnitrophota bacterium]